MDAALKARNLGSATARRQRIQDRQNQRHLAHQEYMSRKQHIMSDAQYTDDSDNDSQCSSSSSPDLDSANETPSEASVGTPDDSSPDVFVTLSPAVYNAVTESKAMKTGLREMNTAGTQQQKGLKMQATLTTMADWNYDRYSMFLDPADVEDLAETVRQAEETDEEMQEESSSSSDSDSDDCSSIETATSITYTMPKLKPTMILIQSSQPLPRPRKKYSLSGQSAVRRHVSEQMLPSTSAEGFQAGEARLFNMSNSSRETVGSMTESMQMSRSLSLASQNESIVSSQTSQSDLSQRSPKRKSSMPLLFSGPKNGHSRMSSIKKRFVRSSTLGPPATNPLFNSGRRNPSTSTLETHFETRNCSMDMPRDVAVEQPQRPMTARAPSPTASVTERMPPLPLNRFGSISNLSSSRLASKESEVTQPKPLSRLRQRSGSIGQALKSIGSGPKKADASAPPVPAIFVPPPTQMVEQSDLIPPPLTPRNPRRSMTNYNVFPAPPKRTSTAVNVGLGLQY